jgi:hypothetical protein
VRFRVEPGIEGPLEGCASQIAIALQQISMVLTGGQDFLQHIYIVETMLGMIQKTSMLLLRIYYHYLVDIGTKQYCEANGSHESHGNCLYLDLANYAPCARFQWSLTSNLHIHHATLDRSHRLPKSFVQHKGPNFTSPSDRLIHSSFNILSSESPLECCGNPFGSPSTSTSACTAFQ